MKTLDQVEARTPISSAPFTINASGSYFLAGNLPVASGNGVTVNADNVTLDLNGFTIASTASPASGTGVRITGNGRNVTIQECCESLNNSTGFAISAAGNLIIGCRASGNTGNNYTIAIGNRGGVIVLPATNAAQINGSSGGAGTGTSDPFANLSY